MINCQGDQRRIDRQCPNGIHDRYPDPLVGESLANGDSRRGKRTHTEDEDTRLLGP